MADTYDYFIPGMGGNSSMPQNFTGTLPLANVDVTPSDAYYPESDMGAGSYLPTSRMPTSTPYQYMDLPVNSSSSAGDWLQNLYGSMMGPGTALGGKFGAFTGGASGGMGAGGQGWLSPLMSIGSGIYGMSQAQRQREEAQRAIAGSSPWTSSGGAAGAGTELTRVMQGDFTNDPGFKAAQLAASRTSSQQPGGFAAQAAAQAALKYQNDRIQALGAPAGVGFSPASGYQLAQAGNASADTLASQSLGSIGYGVRGTQPMPPWLQQYLITNGMGNR